MKFFLILISLSFLVISSFAQNVGIGTISPSEKLHVLGNIKTDTIEPTVLQLTPDACAGKLLISDALGNASWQNAEATGSVGFGPWGDCSVNNISDYNPVVDPDIPL